MLPPTPAKNGGAGACVRVCVRARTCLDKSVWPWQRKRKRSELHRPWPPRRPAEIRGQTLRLVAPAGDVVLEPATKHTAAFAHSNGIITISSSREQEPWPAPAHNAAKLSVAIQSTTANSEQHLAAVRTTQRILT